MRDERRPNYSDIFFFFFFNHCKKKKDWIFLYRENTKHIIKQGSKLMLSLRVIPKIPRGKSSRVWYLAFPKFPT